MTPNQAPRPSDTAAATATGPTTVLLTLSTVLVGLMAGLFFAFDVSVMPGLADTGDDRTYVTAMRAFNSAIDGNALFGSAFLVALLAPATAAVLEFRRGRRATALWTAAAAAAYLVVLVVTFTVNIPLNNELAAGGAVEQLTDLSVVDRFKGTWVATNILRTVLCTAALTALSRALLLHGRTTARTPSH
ncbi:DUF1772 domain-containing protein [Streptomyces sp. NBC_00249]|uniref:DUF1772 domain-containing protein n=1 Tax=Streptomyces sp. NBC_00249 TaxID=2975690 RepID=UPI0022539F7E|nr:DUF1772 domain-containing protein [Streptomyces sp. NBC_00249]MCX5199575.1 DUF1772 domain-containing protein [Streptomyces sp. NBC_00249]